VYVVPAIATRDMKSVRNMIWIDLESDQLEVIGR
jgi:hypothetical protein